MTNKYKISEIAKDFGMTSKEVISVVKDITGEEKKSGASLNETETALLFDAITKKNSVKSFKDYFATGEQSRAEAAKRRAEARDKKLADQMAILEQLKAAAEAAKKQEETPKEDVKPAKETAKKVAKAEEVPKEENKRVKKTTPKKS